jgi:hypothetical protein
MPEPVSAFKKDKIVLPLSLLNNGKVNLKGISLAGIILKDNITRDDFVLDFSKDSFDNLGIGEQENLTLTIDIDTDVLGVYEITINAKVKSPEYLDWGKFYLTIDEDEDVKERLLFTEEFILDNPECIELTEIVNRARQSLENGETTLALQMIDSAVEGCKLAISQTGRLKEKREDISMYIYVIGSILSIFLLSLGSYFYRRMKLSKASLDFEEEKLEMEEKDKLLK